MKNENKLSIYTRKSGREKYNKRNPRKEKK